MKKNVVKICIGLCLSSFLLSSCSDGIEGDVNEIITVPGEISLIDPSTPLDASPSINNSRLKSLNTENWTLVFSDEFDTNQLDSTKWNKTVSSKTRAPRWDKGIYEWYWVADNVSVANGALQLKATKPSANTMYCGSVDTKGLFEPLYGYMEARMQIAPISEAVHTAFWTQGYDQANVDGTGYDGCEVDIFESPYLAEKCQTVLHWDGYGAEKQAKTQHWDAPGLHQGYHTFAMKWTPYYIEIYYDGVKKWTYSGVGYPKVKEWLWLSVGASFGDGDFLNGTYPVYSYVDYVRVWEIPIEVEIECENQSYYSPTGQDINVKTHALASNGQHLRLEATAGDNRIRFDNIYVDEAGTYTVTASGLCWKNFGKYKCSISNNGSWHYFSPRIDLYANTSNRKTVEFGSVYLEAGNHSITFTGDGKNANSSGYLGSFDNIILTKEN